MASCAVNLIGRVKLGHILVIAGTTKADCWNFKVNLTNNEAEIPFSIFVNLRMKEIVMASFVNSEWSKSVKSNIPAVIKSGEPFKIYILVTDDKFHVALNENFLFDYEHRSDLNIISKVKVSGDLEKITQVDHRRAFPTPWPPIQEDLSSVAFSSDVPYNFAPGSVIVMRMVVSGASGGSFFIRFNERATKKQLFHFNPRFEERTVVINCMNDSLEWLASEHRTSDFPFELDKVFQIAIAISSTSFMVAVDGNHFLTYEFKSIQQQLPKAFCDVHPIFDKLTGIKVFALNGLSLQVSHVDHIQLKDDCKFYEIFSNQNYI